MAKHKERRDRSEELAAFFAELVSIVNTPQTREEIESAVSDKLKELFNKGKGVINKDEALDFKAKIIAKIEEKFAEGKEDDDDLDIGGDSDDDSELKPKKKKSRWSEIKEEKRKEADDTAHIPDEAETASYESLSDGEIDILPDEVQVKVRKYKKLEDLLDLYDDSTTAEDERTEIQAFAESLYKELTQTPIVRVIVQFKLVGLVGGDAEKVRKYFEGVIARYDALFSDNSEEKTDSYGEVDFRLHEPEHKGKGEYQEWYVKNFELLVNEMGSDREKLAEIVDLFMMEADRLSAGFLNSNAGSGYINNGRYSALLNFLLNFTKPKPERERSDVIRNFDEYDPTGEFTYTIASKAIEIVQIMYLDELGRTKGHMGSMASDWHELWVLDKAEEDFSIKSFDFMIDDDKGEEGEELRYKNAKSMRWLMFMLPRWIREFEADPNRGVGKEGEKDKWNDNNADAWRSAFDAWLAKKVKRELRGLMTAIDGSADGTFKVPCEKEEDYFSDGTDEEIVFEEDDIADLLDDSRNELKVFLLTAGRMATTLGIRQHLFLNDLARGSTPGGGINDFKKYITIVSPWSLSSYRCYKGFFTHMMVEGFDVNWVPNSSDDKGRLITMSMDLTEQALSQITQLRGDEQKIHLGSIQDKTDQIMTPYPDLYTFVVRSYKRRKDKAGATFQAYDTGLSAFESFTEAALEVPGGIIDEEKLRTMDPKELRTKIIAGLRDLIQNKVSPLKANANWFRWDHVAQFILMYIDRSYRVYRMCDTGERGLLELTVAIRDVLQYNSFNLAGIGKEFAANGVSRGRGKTAKERAVAFDSSETGSSIVGLKTKRVLSGTVPSGSSREPDIRDWLLNRTVKHTSQSAIGYRVGFIDHAVVDGRNSVKRARSEPQFGVPQLITRRGDALRGEYMRRSNVTKMPTFRETIARAKYGTPKAEQKQTENK